MIRDLTPLDDDLHPPTSDDPFWTETAWFAFSVPERSLTGFTYPVFRPNLGVCSAGVYIWDASAEADHEIPYSHNYWHLPIPDTLRSMRLLSGLSYDVIEPLSRYRVRYESHEVSFDLEYTGIVAPQLNRASNHLDQPCRVRGTLDLHGESIIVDGHEMRDKSWFVRPDDRLRAPKGFAANTYTYAVSDDLAFLVRTNGADPDETRVRSGWCLRDGALSRIVSGQRTVERSPGRPPQLLTVKFTDELGRSLTASGRTVNRYPFQSTPGIMAWISGTQWHVDGVDVWGEDQEWLAARSSRK